VIGLVLTVKIKLTGNAPKLKQHQSLFRSTDGQPEIAIWRQTQTRSTCISDSELKLFIQRRKRKFKWQIWGFWPCGDLEETVDYYYDRYWRDIVGLLG